MVAAWEDGCVSRQALNYASLGLLSHQSRFHTAAPPRPAPHLPLQADCPEDTAAYIHRVGRTARYVSSGKGLLLLLPSEKEGMLAQVRRCCQLCSLSPLPAVALF